MPSVGKDVEQPELSHTGEVCVVTITWENFVGSNY